MFPASLGLLVSIHIKDKKFENSILLNLGNIEFDGDEVVCHRVRFFSCSRQQLQIGFGCGVGLASSPVAELIQLLGK